jgi:hypothetical protein
MAAPDPVTLSTIEARLGAILDPYRDRLEAGEIYGVSVLRRPGAKSHHWFAGVQQAGDVVKFNFLPMRAHPEVLDGVSPALLKRRTGASVFKFAGVEEGLFAELEAIVARSYDLYMSTR